MLAVLSSAALVGVDAREVQVEVNAGEEGEPRQFLVGLPDAAVRESDHRIYSALANSGFSNLRARATINLAPGDLRKEGPLYDLPIALAILIATGQLQSERIRELLIAGELSLSGATRPIRGALPIARLARRLGMRGLLLPPGSAEEAALVGNLAVYPVDSLGAAVRFLSGRLALAPARAGRLRGAPRADSPDFSEVKGQAGLRRAMEVAVAGGHNLLVIGPPGSGKSMAARRIPGIMPPLEGDQELDVLTIYSAAGRDLNGPAGSGTPPPFRSPHHSASDAALLGGGPVPGPGEVSLAHHGVLFLDELSEFRRSVLEVLRQPLEEGCVTISRSAGKITFPSAFMLVAAMNPCPCGHLGDPRKRCRCTPGQVERYRARLSGPLLDRIDLHVEAPALSLAEIRSERPAESSAAIRERVLAARARQRARFSPAGACTNARMSRTETRDFCTLSPDLGDLLQQAMERLALSARAYDRVLKVARTIADLAASDSIAEPHLLEAIQYRSLDRTYRP